MGQFVANPRWRPEPKGLPSQYSRMIPGIPAMPSHWPSKKPPASSQGRAGVPGRSPEPKPAKTLAQILLPHTSTDSFPLYLAVAADFLVLTVVCGTQALLLPARSLPLSDLPLFEVLITLLAFAEGVYSESVAAPTPAVVPGLGRSVLTTILLLFFSARSQWDAVALLATGANGLVSLLLYRQIRSLIWARTEHHGEQRNVLIVGGGPVARSIARTLCNDPLRRTFVRGSIDDDLPLSASVLGRIADLDWLARAEFIDEVIVVLPGRPAESRLAAEAALRNHLDIRAVPDLPEGHWPEAGVDFIGNVPVVTLHREPVPSAGLFAKRLIDILGSSVALVLASPVMAMVALLIRLDSHGPIIYGAERTGAKGRRFRCYKFRSMVSDADGLKAKLKSRNQREGPIFKIIDDPRITRVGRFIRRYSFDELPQLWNVLCGDMSMVGPRPHPVEEVNHYELHHYRRLDMKPGISGLWQITARHSPSFDLNMHLDLTYIENWSLRLDLKILLGTIGVLFRPEGA
jgi:exopolysaccharide biosynthesis polyprenyl glycosylphosphotransferase